MANIERENRLGVVDRRRVSTDTSLPGNLAVDNRYSTVASMRTALAARSAYYTSARLEQMTKNDMLYALRLFDDAGGF